VIPADVRNEVKRRLYAAADRIGWVYLPPQVKARYYENWTNDGHIGGILAQFIAKDRVRVYLKDTLLKDYARSTQSDPSKALRLLGLSETQIALEAYEKPHGRRLQDGRIVCWGRAEDWKLILMAVYERAAINSGATPYAAVLFGAIGRWMFPETRNLIEEAGKRLGIGQIHWSEG
jgi:hypothetical protein